jgi:uncharacterized oligopeptide transporter (OPT) family protein
MQQDRSTGARLGTNRVKQFRYQVVGVVMGAILSVVLAQVFLAAYPVLKVNLFANPDAETGGWQSAMTFKFVGALRDLGNLPAHQIKALGLGLGLGLAMEIARKLLHRSERYRRFVAPGSRGFAVGWILDALLLSSPYASSFGGFVELPVTIWWALGGIAASLLSSRSRKGHARPGEGEALPEDMSTTSLVGGGLIAGESLFALFLGIVGLLALV